MEIISETKYSTNVTIKDFITGEEAIASLQAVKYGDGTIEGFICGIPYEQVKATLNPQVESAYQDFINQISSL